MKNRKFDLVNLKNNFWLIRNPNGVKKLLSYYKHRYPGVVIQLENKVKLFPCVLSAVLTRAGERELRIFFNTTHPNTLITQISFSEIENETLDKLPNLELIKNRSIEIASITSYQELIKYFKFDEEELNKDDFEIKFIASNYKTHNDCDVLHPKSSVWQGFNPENEVWNEDGNSLSIDESGKYVKVKTVNGVPVCYLFKVSKEVNNVE